MDEILFTSLHSKLKKQFMTNSYQCNYLLVSVFVTFIIVFLSLLPQSLHFIDGPLAAVWQQSLLATRRGPFSLKRNKNTIFYLLKCLCRSLFALKQTNRDACCQFTSFFKSFWALKPEFLANFTESFFHAPPAETGAIFCWTLMWGSVHDMQTSTLVFICNTKLEI